MRITKSILILGGSGFVGSNIAAALKDRFKVSATYFSYPLKIPGVSFFPLDVTNKHWMKKLVYSVRPDVIIYAVGKNSLEWADQNPLLADRLHTFGVANITEFIDVIQPRFIYLSNPYVFDGFHGNYRETDTLLPGSVIGKVKMASEGVIRTRCLNYLIIRSSPLLGFGSGGELTLFDQWRKKLEQEELMEVSNHEMYSYAPIMGFIHFLIQLIDGGIKNRVLHYGGLTKLTPYACARHFANVFEYNSDLVIPKNIVSQQSIRSRLAINDFNFDFSLNTSSMIELLKLKPFFLQESFDLIKQKLIA